MSVQLRNNVQVSGNGPLTLVFAHGFGCDQHMWRFVAPHFAERCKLVLFDLVGNGLSDLSAYTVQKYDSLDGYATDLLEIVDEFAGAGPVVYVGHSVSSMIGVLAERRMPGRFAGHVMVGPSPCYLDDGDYQGGFSRADIDSLLDTLSNNYLGWSSAMAPMIMGAPGQPELSEELTNSFCRTDPQIAKQFARVTFLSDNRGDLTHFHSKALILQSSDDLIAPVQVGDYLHQTLAGSTLRLIDNVGHCPHMSAPQPCIAAMSVFLDAIEAELRYV